MLMIVLLVVAALLVAVLVAWSVRRSRSRASLRQLRASAGIDPRWGRCPSH
jgi:hypothetical protein